MINKQRHSEAFAAGAHGRYVYKDSTSETENGR